MGKDDPMTNWIENEKVIDSTVLMEQNLEIDRVLNQVKKCCQMITEFWQLYNQEEISSKHFAKFLRHSMKTAQHLQEIKTLVQQIDESNSSMAAEDDNFFTKSY